MKRITRLLAFMVALFSFSITFAETGSETELTANIGGKDQPVVGQSYEVAGTYNAGAGSAQAGNMTSKGFKCRTGSDGNRVVFTVATNYTITKFVGEGISNYAMAEGVEGDVNVKVTKVEVDGVEVGFTGGEFPAKGADHSGNLTIDNIQATESIAIYFDNSNSAGKQLNLCYAIDWERPDASEPTITVTPSVVNLIPSATYKLSAKIDPASFTTVWKSANEAIATVAEDGTVTAVAPGVVEVSNQWTENADVKGAATITVNNIDLSKYAVVKAYDFTVMGDVELALQSEAAGNIWNEANKKANPVYFCTNEGLEQIAVQAAAASNGKGWSIVDGKGLFLGTGAGRCAAVAGITKGQIVEFIYTGDAFYTNPAGDDGIEKEALNEGKGRAIYRASEDGMIGFELIKGNAIEKINVYDVDLVTLPKLLTFPDYNDQEISAYDKEWTATVDGAVWTLNGFNNNKNAWNYVRCGRKAKAQTATILSPALYANVTNVVYTVDKTSNVTKATVTVLNGEETVNTIDITEKFAAGNVNVEVEGQPGYSYLLTIDSDDQATGNGPTQISKVALYAEGQYVEVHIANTEDDPYTVEKAIELIEAGEALNEIVYVKGIITQVDEVNAEYGNATYWIADSEGAEQQLQVYRGLNIGGEKFTSEEQLEVGATVVVKGQLLKYGSKYELNQGNELVSYSAPVDVTSEYLKNADFAASTATDAEKIFGYGKDGQPYGLQDVEEWTKVVVAGDNANADYPDSGLGGAVIAYGSPTLLQGGGKAAPEAGPDGEAGNSLGFFAVWSCSGYYAQDVKLPAGKYTLTVPVFNQGGTQVNGSFIGFFPEGQETGYTVDANVAPGEWTSQSVSFVLTKETAGQVRLGYAAANTGSANSPMLFIDGVDLKFAEVDAATIAKADLQAEIAAAEALLATGAEGKAELEAAIAKAKEVLASATSADELNAALAALKDAELAFKEANKPVPNGTYYVMCASEEGDWFMAAGHNWGTRAIINNDGLDLTLNFDAPTGTYTIDTQVFNGNAKHFLGSDLYMDGAAFGWTIASDNGFTFTISNGTQYIGIDSDYNLALTDQPAEWAFLKADARIMALDEASAENPVDATFLVKGANFNRNDKRNDAWTRTSETADGGTNFNISGGNNVNNCAESYHAKFSLSQTVEGLPNGIYEMTAQGFYRQDGEDAENLPYFFINDEKVTFPLKTGEENSMANASESFTNGLYTIEPIKIVVEDGKITLGAKNDENLNLWCIWDNFRLTYYGAAPSDGKIDMVKNGNLEGDDVSNYFSKEYPSTDIVASTIVEGAGTDGTRGIVVKTQDKAKEAWDSQFFIKFNETAPDGMKLHIEFDYKADQAASIGTQAHGAPGAYMHWAAIGNVDFTPEWQHFSKDVTVEGAMANMQTIAFNLNDKAEANNYYFDNFVVKAEAPEPVDEWVDIAVNGTMEDADMQGFYVTEQGIGGPYVALPAPGMGKDGSQAVVVNSGDSPANDWDTQFFIRLPYQLPAGTKYKVSFDYKADKAGGFATQAHAEPGAYIHWDCIGSGNFSTEWQTYEKEGSVSADMSKEGQLMQTIAFNLALNKEATEFVFDNVKFEIPKSVADKLTPNPAVDPKPYPTVAEGKLYLQNVATGKFLAAGHSWGTRSIVNADGLDFTVAKAADGKYTLDSQVANNATNHFLGDNLFVDSPEHGWTIKVAAGGNVTISNANGYLVVGENDETAQVAEKTDAALWKMLSYEDRIAALAGASDDAPANATFAIKDANFGRNDQRRDAWETWSETADGGTNFNISGGNNENNNAESYHAKFSISQTIEGLPNGVYGMTVQGFYRQDGEDAENLPYFFINDQKVTFPVKTGAENSMSDASVSFTSGLYTTTPVKVVVTDGKITLGAKNDANLNLWCIWDNFQLTYYGENADVNMLAEDINIDRMATQGYTAQEATVDFAQAKAWLGVDAITTDMLRIENPDGELISDYAPFDGWFNTKGIAETWGDLNAEANEADKAGINVKFFQAIPDGVFTICDMNGADVVGNTYTVRWKLVNGEKSVRYKVNVTFVEYEEPLYTPEIVKTIDVPVTMKPATAYEGITATFPLDEVVSALGVAAITDAKQYIVNVTNGNFVANTTDGWRNAEGDAANWGTGEGMVCVKIQDPASGTIDYLGAIDETYQDGATYTAKWGFVNAEEKAVVLNINITFSTDNGIETIDMLKGEGTIYNLRGQKVDKPVKGGLYIVNGKKVMVK